MVSDIIAYIFISIKTLYIVERVTSTSVLDKVDWARSIVLDKATIINI